MGALPKFEPELAEIVDVNGEQMLHLPKSLRVVARQFRIQRTGDSLQLEPVRPRQTRTQIEAWLRSMHELDAGDVIPGGRNQGITEPEDIFPSDFFGESGE